MGLKAFSAASVAPEIGEPASVTMPPMTASAPPIVNALDTEHPTLVPHRPPPFGSLRTPAVNIVGKSLAERVTWRQNRDMLTRSSGYLKLIA